MLQLLIDYLSSMSPMLTIIPSHQRLLMALATTLTNIKRLSISDVSMINCIMLRSSMSTEIPSTSIGTMQIRKSREELLSRE
jgi:hypothetical protein